MGHYEETRTGAAIKPRVKPDINYAVYAVEYGVPLQVCKDAFRDATIWVDALVLDYKHLFNYARALCVFYRKGLRENKKGKQ